MKKAVLLDVDNTIYDILYEIQEYFVGQAILMVDYLEDKNIFFAQNHINDIFYSTTFSTNIILKFLNKHCDLIKSHQHTLIQIAFDEHHSIILLRIKHHQYVALIIDKNSPLSNDDIDLLTNEVADILALSQTRHKKEKYNTKEEKEVYSTENK